VGDGDADGDAVAVALGDGVDSTALRGLREQALLMTLQPRATTRALRTPED